MTARLPLAVVPPLATADRPSETAIELAQLVIVGAPSQATDAWLRHALLRWIRSDGAETLSQALHLGRSPRHVRLVIRNRWLREAATYVDGSEWQRAKALAIAADHFERYKWPAWRHRETLPLDAGTPVELALHGARMADALPRTAEAYLAIIRD